MTQQMNPFDPQTAVGAPGPTPGAPAGPPPAGPGWTAPQYPAVQPPSPPRRRTGLIAAVGGGVVAVAGLGVGALLLFGPKTLDTAELTDQISAATQEQAGVAPTAVTCPADIEAKVGDTFRCTAELEGQPVSFTVEQTDDDGNVRFDLDTQFVVVEKVESAVTDQVSADFAVEVTSDCESDGHSVLVDAIGVPLTCTVTNVDDPADTLSVQATVAEDGSVSYETE